MSPHTSDLSLSLNLCYCSLFSLSIDCPMSTLHSISVNSTAHVKSIPTLHCLCTPSTPSYLTHMNCLPCCHCTHTHGLVCILYQTQCSLWQCDFMLSFVYPAVCSYGYVSTCTCVCMIAFHCLVYSQCILSLSLSLSLSVCMSDVKSDV